MSRQNVGTYTCKLINEVGVNISKAKLSVMDKPKSDDTMKPATPKIKTRKPVKPKKPEVETEEVQICEDIVPETYKAKSKIHETTLHQVTVSEVRVQEVIKKIKEVEIKTALVLKETLECLQTEELKPVEVPINQLAKIGFYIQHGVTSEEILVLISVGHFSELFAPNIQSALINVVERLGHSAIVTQVLSEATVDDHLATSTIGFRAFMRMIEMSHVTIEEVLTQFTITDFEQPIWQTKQASQVIFEVTTLLRMRNRFYFI